MKKYKIRFFCADQIDITTNFAVITNVVIKRVHCTVEKYIKAQVSHPSIHLKIGTPKMITLINLNMKQFDFCNAVVNTKYTDGNAIVQILIRLLLWEHLYGWVATCQGN